MASVDFSNYACGITEISPSQELLSNVLSNKLFNACIGASKLLSESGVSVVLKDIDITRCILLSIETEIIPTIDNNNIVKVLNSESKVSTLNNEVKDNVTNNQVTDNSIYKPQPATRAKKHSVIEIKTDSISNNETENETNTTTDHETKSSLRSLYSPGSVIATINVLYHAKESYESKLTEKGDTETNYLLSNLTNNISTSRNSSSIWTFQGCISGHSELDWKVVALDGLG